MFYTLKLRRANWDLVLAEEINFWKIICSSCTRFTIVLPTLETNKDKVWGPHIVWLRGAHLQVNPNRISQSNMEYPEFLVAWWFMSYLYWENKPHQWFGSHQPSNGTAAWMHHVKYVSVWHAQLAGKKNTTRHLSTRQAFENNTSSIPTRLYFASNAHVRFPRTSLLSPTPGIYTSSICWIN